MTIIESKFMRYKKFDSKVPDLKIPENGDAGIDLYCTHDIEWYDCNDWKEVNTGIGLEIPKGYCGIVISRSGTRFNDREFVSSGLIDSSYRGEIKLLMQFDPGIQIDYDFKTNEKDVSFIDSNTHIIFKYSKVAQIVIVPYFVPEKFEKVKELSESIRGESGFGSSGK